MPAITIAGLSNSERSRINRALNQLQTACPDPPARELIRRAEAYRHNSGRPLLPPPPSATDCSGRPVVGSSYLGRSPDHPAADLALDRRGSGPYPAQIPKKQQFKSC